MRTASGLFKRLCDPGALDHAARLTVRGKRRRPDVAWFLFNRENELARLQTDLAKQRYRPSRYELLRIHDPKPRLIARLPIADRVVQTALVKQMEPHFARSLTDDCFACRDGFGTHRAVLRLWREFSRHRHVLHLDIKAYFPSVDLDILRRLLARTIRDEPFLELIDRVLEAPRKPIFSMAHRDALALRGLPIGSYTSQLFAAHVYLNGFDHYVKRSLHAPAYLRYVDDLFIFGNHREELRRWRRLSRDWLWEKRRLRLKRPNAPILSCRGELHALGYRLTRGHLEALPRTLRRIEHRVMQQLYRGSPVDFAGSLAAAAGVVLF